MKFSRALLSGLLGAMLVYVIVLVAGALAGSHADLCGLLGSSVTGAADSWTWLLGALGQLALGVVVAIVYGAIFEWVTQRAGAAVGFIIALAHAIVAGLAVGFLPAGHLIEANIAPPGAFMEYRGTAVVGAFVIAHLVFGTIVGTLYGRPRHTVATRVIVWRQV